MITHNPAWLASLLALLCCAGLSAQCDIFPIDLSAYICDDNGTPGDPSDDTFTFTITMDGIGTGTDYNYNNPFVSGTGTYGVPETVGPIPVDQMPFNLGFSDVDNPNCVYLMNLDPGPGCINPSCALNAQFVNYECDDGGTDTDPTDDTFTVELLVQGVGTFSAGWDATGFVNTSGAYNVPELLGPFTVYTGVTGVQVTDNDNPGCLDFATVFSPGACSNGCNITTVVPFSVLCSDAGTPGDTSDDFIVIDLFATGDNLSVGSGYTVTTSVGTLLNPNGSYNIGSIFQLFDAAPATTVTLTLTDDDDPSCQATIDVTIPGDCGVANCQINDATVSDITCFTNGTSTPDDDVYTFIVEVSGDNLGSGWTSDDPFNNFGNYNTPDLFGPFLISDGSQTITFTDNDDPSCTFTITVDPPAPCSVPPACNITDAGLGAVQCLDGGTPNDPSDDFINFLVNPTGLGSNFIIQDPSGTTIYGSGVYGNPASGTSLPGAAGNGDLTIVIVDGDDPTCTLTLTIPDPGACSTAPPCTLTDLGLQLIGCSDNGTPNNPDDDFFEFILDPVGTNVSDQYAVNSLPGVVIPFVGSYGGPTTFLATQFVPGVTTITINVIDEDDANCTLQFTIDLPEDCGVPACDITLQNFSPVTCSDAGTPSDPSDDVITFNLDVSGTGIGTDYSLSASGGYVVSPGTGTYGTNNTFTLDPGSAGNGDVTITLIDNSDPSCTLTIILTDPGTCSNTPACNITDAGLGTVTCNDFGTPNSPGDDFLEIELNPTGSGLGGQYIVTSPLLSASPGFGNYGSPTIQQFLNAGANPGVDIPITITDADDPNCSITIFVPNIAPCSNAPCSITALSSNVQCDDNGTPNDPTDDTFTFDLLVNGTETGPGWTANDPNNTTGIYGSITQLGPYPISGGDLSFTVADDTDPSCTAVVNVFAPAPCSVPPPCSISAIPDVSFCDDNGTPNDPTDDVFFFELLVNGTNTGATWVSDDPNNSTGNYGANTLLGPYPISDGDLSITIADVDDPTCTTSVIVVAPAPCSVPPPCTIGATVSNIDCDDNGTPNDPLDDTFTFDLLVTGTNVGTAWGSDDPNNSFGNYNQITSLGPFLIDAGNLNFSIFDLDDPTCSVDVSVNAPAPCSIPEPCTINATASNILCDDNGTPNDPLDDTFIFDLLITGTT